MKLLVPLADLIQKHKGHADWSELLVGDKNNRITMRSSPKPGHPAQAANRSQSKGKSLLSQRSGISCTRPPTGGTFPKLPVKGYPAVAMTPFPAGNHYYQPREGNIAQSQRSLLDRWSSGVAQERQAPELPFAAMPKIC
jgi:hypothetical protein